MEEAVSRNPNWQRDESLLALDLYLQDGMLSNHHPKVIQLSTLLKRLWSSSSVPRSGSFRNPEGIAMKLANFASLDPGHRGISLSHVSQQEIDVWNEFHNDRYSLAQEVARVVDYIETFK
jgi:5-methylcytosine-specific restriction enzyme A